MLNENLAPVTHSWNLNLVRVPVRRIDDHFIVYVDDGYHRRYDKDTLPDDLKTKLTMILAVEHTVIPDRELSRLDLYSNTQSLDLDEIGWRASETYYCVVVTYESMMAMRGENT